MDAKSKFVPNTVIQMFTYVYKTQPLLGAINLRHNNV